MIDASAIIDLPSKGSTCVSSGTRGRSPAVVAWAEQHLLHRRQNTQGLLPLPTIITSTDCGIVGCDSRQNSSLLHHRQETQGRGLLPLPAIITSTDGSNVG